MKRIVRFFRERFSRTPVPPAPMPRPYTETVRMVREDLEESKSLGAEVAEWLDDHESVASSPVDDVYTEGYDPTVPDLKILDVKTLPVDDTPGVDPYDTLSTKKEDD